MFAKLLKHDFKANAGLLSLLAGCALGVGCVAAVILRLLTTYWDSIMSKDEYILLLIPAFLFLFFAYLAVIFYSAASQYILLFRFYKSRFTDEGYLMFTLPVKTSHIFLSGAVNQLIWSAISIVVVFASLAIAIGLGPAWTPEVAEEARWILNDMQSVFTETLTPGYGLSTILYMLVAAVYGVVTSLSAVVLGSTVAKKHKVLAIIGILIGISMVTSTITGIISGIMQILMFTSDAYFSLVMTLTPLISSGVLLLITVGGYFLSIHLMKKRLNLP